jgi:hypothetical protein
MGELVSLKVPASFPQRPTAVRERANIVFRGRQVNGNSSFYINVFTDAVK